MESLLHTHTHKKKEKNAREKASYGVPKNFQLANLSAPQKILKLRTFFSKNLMQPIKGKKRKERSHQGGKK